LRPCGRLGKEFVSCCPQPDYITTPSEKQCLNAVRRQGELPLLRLDRAGGKTGASNAGFGALWPKLAQTR